MAPVTQRNTYTPSTSSAINANQRHAMKTLGHSLEEQSRQGGEETPCERWVDIEATILA